MKKNILGAFALALLVLMGTGFAFGHWQDWVYVDGYVNTGRIDVVPSYEGSNFDYWNYKPYTQGKGVAWDNVTVVDSTLYIELYNVYPGVCWYGMFNIENNGTVPAGFYNISAMSSNPGLKLVPVGPMAWNVSYDLGSQWSEPIAVLSIGSFDNDGPSSLCQIDPGYPLLGWVTICFMNPLPQNTTFYFDLTLEFWNWNEVCLQ